MNTLFNIRPANINDAASIASIGYSCFQDTYKGLVSEEFLQSIDLEKQIERAETTIKQGGSILMATDDKHYAVGYCAFGSTRETLHPRENEIYSLFISKRARGSGLGTILLYEAERIFPVAKPVMVRILRGNTLARNFFEGNGFKYLPDRDGTFRNVAPDVAYIKYIC
jgi:ribosomal protein S18 acetylase RimI-like enzyme